MNIELDEVVVRDVSDDALELAADGAQGGLRYARWMGWFRCTSSSLADVSSCLCTSCTWDRL